MTRKTAVSSPASTGGAGTFFEQHVNAHWLALLLVRGIPPILHDSSVVEVHLQTEHLGWSTDDFLVVAEDGAGARRKLAGQVKRTFTVSAADEECKKTVRDFWKDYTANPAFSKTTDRFALVVLRGTNTLLEHFAGLLDLARSVVDDTEFERRLGVQGLVHAKAIEYCDAIRAIVGGYEGRSISAREIWPLLRVLHVLSLDLNTSTRQTEAHVKSLLAHTIAESGGRQAAEATWAVLLQQVGEGMPGARSYTRDTLPEDIRSRHPTIGGTYRRALQVLADHSDLILQQVRSTIGPNLHLPRAKLVQRVLEGLESEQIVLVSGSAGSGKSAIAKDVARVLAPDGFVFWFRAEEFACAHFDDTLHRAQLQTTGTQLGAILAGQGRKVIFVESIERLLEAATRDAFADLLTLVHRDKTWRLVLTCRDYSADLVRSCFLSGSEASHKLVKVLPLDDVEISDVAAACPQLARPLGSPHLRGLLRNPYVLDKALQIDWLDDRPLPDSEREFRSRFWRDVVRVDDRPGAGMPRRREEAFEQVALRRARALTLYAYCRDLDAEAMAALYRDSLVVAPPQQEGLAAPTHDVLEDWAILRWIDERHVVCAGAASEFAATIGTEPALRRVFRKWVGELATRDQDAADALFEAATTDLALPAHFRDDLTIALLLAADSPGFLKRHAAKLLAENRRLLHRVIHLLRVACVKNPAGSRSEAGGGFVFSEPDGPAWSSVLCLVQDELPSLQASESQLLLGLLEDWARGVSWQAPYPEGAEAVAAIAHHLLSYCEGYRQTDQLQRTLRVIARIPNADPKAFSMLLRGGGKEQRERHLTEEMRAIVLEGIDGAPACRDLPREVIEAARDQLLCSEKDLRSDPFGYSPRAEVETAFGIREAARFDYFPASAIRGPFLPLLRFHWRDGLKFILSLLNQSATWYANPRVHQDIIEPPFEVTLTLPDGTERKQAANWRLWGLYRGLSVGPYVMQCALMALEQWLLDWGATRPASLDALLASILAQSESAAATAVIASVATAFPHLSGETLLVLLSSRECVRLDRVRLSQESGAGVSRFLPDLNQANEIYNSERRQADEKPHRRRDLEWAIANLQLGQSAARVQQVLDKHLAAMPPVDKQDEEDRVWRLALHRMDLRQYRVAASQPEAGPGADGESSGNTKVMLALVEPAPDLREMVEESATQLEAVASRIGLQMWGKKTFERDQSSGNDTTQWRERLAAARQSNVELTDEDYGLGRGAAGLVAAVCARDHWGEMSGGDQKWCLDTICAEVRRDADNWDQFARVQRGAVSSDRHCASVLSTLLGKQLESADRDRVLRTFALAHTHAIREVRAHAAAGVAEVLWADGPELALRTVDLLGAQATLVQQKYELESSKPYAERRKLDAVEAEAAGVIRRRFVEETKVSATESKAFDPAGWVGSEASIQILTILGGAPDEAAAVEAYCQLAGTLVKWWDSDEARDKRRQRNFQAEADLRELLVSFLSRTSDSNAVRVLPPILEAVDSHPRETQWIVLGLVAREDRCQNTTHFWRLWGFFAERVCLASWLPHIDDEYCIGSEMMSTIFLGNWWKAEVRHWKSLEGHAHAVDALFEALPPSSTVLDDYVRFLYHIGEQSLPRGFIRIADKLRAGDPSKMLAEGNTVFMLERLLERHIYARPLELKKNQTMRVAVLQLVDLLVDAGSSAAFKMRDDFVTPLPVS